MKTWIGFLVAVVVIGGGYWWWQSQSAASVMSDDGTPAAVDAVDDANGGDAATTPAPSSGTDVAVGATVSADSKAPMTATVTFDGNSFSPATVTIAKGGTVTFVSTAGNMWVASNAHPEHTGYSGTSRSQHCPDTSGTAFDQCTPGKSYSFTFQKTGTWPYHDHLAAVLGGTVIVQ